MRNISNGDYALRRILDYMREENRRRNEHDRYAYDTPEWMITVYEAAGYDKILHVIPYMMLLDKCWGNNESVEALIERIKPSLQRIYDILGMGVVDIDYDEDADELVFIPDIPQMQGLSRQYSLYIWYDNPGDNLPLQCKEDIINKYSSLLTFSEVQSLIGDMPFRYDGRGRYIYTGNDEAVLKKYGRNAVWEHKDGRQMADVSGHEQELNNSITLWLQQQYPAVH